MVAHVIELQEVGIAMGALVPLARMPSYVGLQIVALAEALGALVTLVRAFARMGAHMYGQIVGTMETLAAGVAQIGLGASVVPVKANAINQIRRQSANQLGLVRSGSLTARVP